MDEGVEQQCAATPPVAGGGMLVTTQKPDKTAFGMNGRSKSGFEVPRPDIISHIHERIV